MDFQFSPQRSFILRLGKVGGSEVRLDYLAEDDSVLLVKVLKMGEVIVVFPQNLVQKIGVNFLSYSVNDVSIHPG